jgi:hypothetical protein
VAKGSFLDYGEKRADLVYGFWRGAGLRDDIGEDLEVVMLK